MKSIELYIKESILDGPPDLDGLTVGDRYDIINMHVDDEVWTDFIDYKEVEKQAKKIKNPVGPAFKPINHQYKKTLEQLCMLFNNTPLIDWQTNMINTLESVSRKGCSVNYEDEANFKSLGKYQIWYNFERPKGSDYEYGEISFTLRLKK